MADSSAATAMRGTPWNSRKLESPMAELRQEASTWDRRATNSWPVATGLFAGPPGPRAAAWVTRLQRPWARKPPWVLWLGWLWAEEPPWVPRLGRQWAQESRWVQGLRWSQTRRQSALGALDSIGFPARSLVLQRRVKEECLPVPDRRRGASRVSAWLVRCALGCPPAIAAVPGVRTVPGAASLALPGTLGAG